MKRISYKYDINKDPYKNAFDRLNFILENGKKLSLLEAIKFIDLFCFGAHFEQMDHGFEGDKRERIKMWFSIEHVAGGKFETLHYGEIKVEIEEYWPTFWMIMDKNKKESIKLFDNCFIRQKQSGKEYAKTLGAAVKFCYEKQKQRKGQ
ncbi:MAG: hypothetical protein FWC51_03335 [Proteobacteria bacterium]|nr:hypothetical protein [Pseudomonadota bacterium]